MSRTCGICIHTYRTSWHIATSVNGKSATAAATTESAGRVAPKRQPGKGLDYDALMALAARATTGGNAGATVPATNTSSSSSTATTSQLVKVSKAPVPALDSVRRRGSVANNRMPPSTARRSASLTKAYRAAGAAPQPAGRAPKPAMESAKTTSTGLVVVPARGKFGMHAIQSGLAAASNGKRSIYAKQQAQPAAKIARAGVNMGEVVVLNTVKRDLRSVDQIQTDIRMRKLAAQEAAAAKDKTNNAARNVSPVTATKPLSVKLIVKEPVRGFAPSLDEKQVNAKATSIMPVAKATSAKPATTKTPTKPASKLVTAKSSSANKSVSPRTNLPPPPSVAPKSATKRRAPLPPHVEEVDPRLCDESYVQSNYKDLIRGMFGTKRQYNDDDDEDDVSDDMEATYDEIEREERKR